MKTIPKLILALLALICVTQVLSAAANPSGITPLARGPRDGNTDNFTFPQNRAYLPQSYKFQN